MDCTEEGAFFEGDCKYDFADNQDITPLDSSTRVVTPQTEAASQEFVLSYNTIKWTTSIPLDLDAGTKELRREFLLALGEPGVEEPLSGVELASRYLGFLATRIAPSKYPSLDLQVLEFLLDRFEDEILLGSEIHAFFAGLPDALRRSDIISCYYLALETVKRPFFSPTTKSALFRAASHAQARIFAVFGGQGNTLTYLDELQNLYTMYPSMIRTFLSVTTAHLCQLADASSGVAEHFEHGMHVLRWLENPDAQPDVNYLISAPVSFPIIGLAQLAHVVVVCSILGMHPGQLRDHLAGVTGHSQGIVTAVVIAASDDWDSFMKHVKDALTILFWIGVRSQQAYPCPSIPQEAIEDSEQHGEGTPTSALCIRGLPCAEVERYVETTNKHLPIDQRIVIGLVNSPRNLVTAGPPLSLYGLCRLLRDAQAPVDFDDSRVRFSQRKRRFIKHFLPITAPFHSPYLEEAAHRLRDDLKSVEILSKELRIPLYSTCTGQDMRVELQGENIVPLLIKLIVSNSIGSRLYNGRRHLMLSYCKQ
jgi:fatty acid synthase subunit beta, fungi type